mgnify:FL=1|tara:strand:- start:338 stop:628 length:291 start_codon:yes stop_codon:yes gene_type:complete
MGKGCHIIHKECDPTLAQDKSLPYNAFLIEYLEKDITKFDIANGDGQVDIFDDYWDKYKSNLKNMTQTEGRANPKMWKKDPSKPIPPKKPNKNIKK